MLLGYLKWVPFCRETVIVSLLMNDAKIAWERIVQSLHYNGVIVVELNDSQKRQAAQLL
jgi:hypothetical protein